MTCKLVLTIFFSSLCMFFKNSNNVCQHFANELKINLSFKFPGLMIVLVFRAVGRAASFLSGFITV